MTLYAKLATRSKNGTLTSIRFHCGPGERSRHELVLRPQLCLNLTAVDESLHFGTFFSPRLIQQHDLDRRALDNVFPSRHGLQWRQRHIWFGDQRTLQVIPAVNASSVGELARRPNQPYPHP